jgi:hypothetical protein
MGGQAGAPAAAGGGHFCEARQADAETAFYFGVQHVCVATSSRQGPISALQRMLLDASRTSQRKGTVVAECPRAETVAYCDAPLIVPFAGTTRTNVYKAAVNSDSVAVALNAPAICGGGAPFDVAGKALRAPCTGGIKAKVDGQVVDFSESLTCFFKDDGARAQWTISAQAGANRPDGKTLSLTIARVGGVVRFGDAVLGGMSATAALMPGYGYLEGDTASGAFSFPKDATQATVQTTRFESRGAGLTGTFSLGDLHTQPNGRGAMRTITEGTLDVKLDPS